ETVCGLAFRRRHDARVADHYVERLARLDQRIGTGAHAFQRSEIELDEFEALAMRGVLADGLRGALRLVQVPRRADDRRAMRRKRSRRFDTEARRGASHQDALAREVHAFENLVGGGFSAECPCHEYLREWSVQVHAVNPCSGPAEKSLFL